MPFLRLDLWPVGLLLLVLAAGCRGPLAKIPGNPLARDTKADYVRYGRTPSRNK